MNKEQMFLKVFKSWRKELITDETETTVIKSILFIDKLVKQKVKFYPETSNIFRVFKELDYNTTNVVLLAQDPYFDGSADGLAFSNSKSTKLSPSLRNIFKEISQEYETEMDLSDKSLWDLTRWLNQGVFLYNTALTVEHKLPGSHLEYWKDFTSCVINTLNKKENLVWILLGKNAQVFEQQINKNHCILCAPHPAAETYSGGKAGFFGSNVFIQCNEYLKSKNLKEIQWLGQED